MYCLFQLKEVVAGVASTTTSMQSTMEKSLLQGDEAHRRAGIRDQNIVQIGQRTVDIRKTICCSCSRSRLIPFHTSVHKVKSFDHTVSNQVSKEMGKVSAAATAFPFGRGEFKACRDPIPMSAFLLLTFSHFRRA